MPHLTLQEVDSDNTAPNLKESVWHFKASWSAEAVIVRFTCHLDQLRLFRWYLEQHAVNEPLDGLRARQAEAGLAHVLKTLCDALPTLEEISGAIILDIVAKDGDSTSHSIPWELLETSDFAAGNRITIRRRTDRFSLAPLSLMARGPGTFNIAVLAARSDQQNDDYQQAALSMLRLLQDLPAETPRIRVDIVRPATYKGLQGYLQDTADRNQRPHLVHFDTHGGLSKDLKSAVLYFSNNRTKSAKAVAELLKAHGVRLAVLNACESARADRGARANLAQVFVDDGGLQAVLAMSYQYNASAVPRFVEVFYENFLRRGLSFSMASRAMRLALSQDCYRKGRFGLQVKLQDWFVPVIYCASDADPAVTDYVTSAGDRRQTRAILPSGAQDLGKFPADSQFQGRDRDILQLETMLLENSREGRGRLAFLEGKLGIGKTTLLLHAKWWWTCTGMVSEAIYFDMAQHQNKRPADICQAILKQIGHSAKSGQGSSQQALCDYLSSGAVTGTSIGRVTRPRKLLILDHFYVGQWPFAKDAFTNDDPAWNEWKTFLTRLSRIEAYTITASNRWPWVLDYHDETSEFPKETIYFLNAVKLCRSDAMTQLGSQTNANAIIASPQDQDHLDIIVQWCEPYPPLLAIIGPLVRVLGVAGLAKALTTGQDLSCYREFNQRAVEKSEPWLKAQKFWKSTPNGAKRQLLCLAPFHNYLPRCEEAYFRAFARDDQERYFSRLDFLGKYAPDAEQKKAAALQAALGPRLELASAYLVFIKILKGIGLIRAELVTGSSDSGKNADGTKLHSIHPVFSLFLRRQARKEGYLNKPDSKTKTKKSLCLEQSFVNYHEERAMEWIQRYDRGAQPWDASQEMRTGKENFKTAMNIRLQRPVGTFDYEGIPALLYWCYKTTGEPFRVLSPVAPRYLAECVELSLQQLRVSLRRCPDPEKQYQICCQMMQLQTWLAMHYLVEDYDRKKFDKVVTAADKFATSVATIWTRLTGLPPSVGEFAQCQEILSRLKAVQEQGPSRVLSVLATLPARAGASTNPTTTTWAVIQKFLVMFESLSLLQERAFSLAYWDLESRVCDIDELCKEMDDALVELSPLWPEFLASLDSEILATLRCLGFHDEDDGVPMPDVFWDDVADRDLTALQPPNYASKVMASLREGKSLDDAKQEFQMLWDNWLASSSRGYGLAALDIYAGVGNEKHRTNIENISLIHLSLQGDWASVNQLLDCLLVNERHCRLEDMSEDDVTRLAGWHHQKAVFAYHTSQWQLCVEHLSKILDMAARPAGLARRVLFNGLMLLVLLGLAAPDRASSVMPVTDAIYYSLLLAYSEGDEKVYAENGALLSLLLQAAAGTQTTKAQALLPLEFELSLKRDRLDIGNVAPKDVPELIQLMKLSRAKNRDFALTSRFLQRLRDKITNPDQDPRQTFADAEVHLFRHRGSCGCGFDVTAGAGSTQDYTTLESMINSDVWPKFDLKAATSPVVRPQLLSTGSLAVAWLQQHFRPAPGHLMEHERETEMREYLGQWHAAARD